MTTVALDGRGAERGAEVIVAGARAAAADGIAVRVFGDPGGARGARRRRRRRAGRGAPAEITNDEEPVGAVRETPDASIVLAAADVAEGRSRGARQRRADRGDDDRGAVRAAARCTASAARRSRSSSRSPAATARRPCCSTSAPTPRSAPATSSSSPTSAPPSASAVLGVERPRVALLSVGEEPKKGTQDVVDAHAELAAAERARLPRQRRGPRPARRRGRRDRHRRLHRQRRAEDDRGHRARGRRRGRRGRALEPGRRASAACCCARRSAACAARWTPTRPAARSCSGCAASPSSATAARAPDGIANAIRLAARAVESGAVERTAELLERSGATRAAMRDRKEAQ